LRRVGVVGVILLSLLAGCAPAGKEWTPGPIITESVTPFRPSPGPTPSTTPTKPAKPTVPDATGALDVSSFESAHFASPTGRIWCALAKDWTLCHFPRDMNTSKVPKPSKVCPGAGLDVTGVSVIKKAEYFCSGGAEALPQTDGEYTGWWPATGYPAVTYDGQKLATLPYGRKLVHGAYLCLSEQSGITCGNSTTGAGFKISRAGVTFIS
jgi:hypothetical protein